RVPQLSEARGIADLAFVRGDAAGAGGLGGYAAGRVDRNGVAGPVDERVAAARRIDAAEVEPLDIAALVLRHAGKPRRYRLGQAEVGAGAQSDAVAAALDGLDVAGVAAGRPLREQSHCAADRVATRQRALRSAQHFDPLEVEQVEDRSRQRGIIDVVDIEADARLDRGIEVELAHPADVGAERR